MTANPPTFRLSIASALLAACMACAVFAVAAAGDANTVDTWIAGNGVWDTSAVNWLANGQTTRFRPGDVINFDGLHPGVVNVTAGQTVTGGIYISGDNNYFLVGQGVTTNMQYPVGLYGIAVSGRLVLGEKVWQTGNATSAQLNDFRGILDLSGQTGKNTFQEGISIYSGTLRVANADQLGTGLDKLYMQGLDPTRTATLAVAAGGSLVFDAHGSASLKSSLLSNAKFLVEDGAALEIRGSSGGNTGPLQTFLSSDGVTIATEGDGVFRMADNVNSTRGGAVYSDGKLVIAGNAEFTGNQAHYGGAIFLGVNASLAFDLDGEEKVLFSGNTDGVYSNSIMADYTTPISMAISLKDSSVLDMRDPMVLKSAVSIVMGADGLSTGEWRLGGRNLLAAQASSIDIRSGTLHLYGTDEVANPSSGNPGGTMEPGTLEFFSIASAFRLAQGATLSVGGDNLISAPAGGIVIEGGSTLSFDLSRAESGGDALLRLNAMRVELHNANANTIVVNLDGDGIESGRYFLVEKSASSSDSFVPAISRDITVDGQTVTGTRLANRFELVLESNRIILDISDPASGIVSWAVPNGEWNYEEGNWAGRDADGNVFTAFDDGDIVLFDYQGRDAHIAGDRVVVSGLYFSGDNNHVITGSGIVADAASGSLEGNAVTGKMILGADATFDGNGRAVFTGSSQYNGTVDLTGTTENEFRGGVEIRRGELAVNDEKQLGTSLSKLELKGVNAGEARLRLGGGGDVAFDGTANGDQRLALNAQGTIVLDSGTSMVVRNNAVAGADGGALAVGASGNFRVEAPAAGSGSRLELSGNSTDASGGAVSVGGGIMELANVSLKATGNAAGRDGGAVSNSGSLLLSSDSEFSGNRAGGRGGAIYNAGGLALHAGSFTDNTAAGAGGAIYTAIGTMSAMIGGGETLLFSGNANLSDGASNSIHFAGSNTGFNAYVYTGGVIDMRDAMTADGDGVRISAGGSGELRLGGANTFAGDDTIIDVNQNLTLRLYADGEVANGRHGTVDAGSITMQGDNSAFRTDNVSIAVGGDNAIRLTGAGSSLVLGGNSAIRTNGGFGGSDRRLVLEAETVAVGTAAGQRLDVEVDSGVNLTLETAGRGLSGPGSVEKLGRGTLVLGDADMFKNTAGLTIREGVVDAAGTDQEIGNLELDDNAGLVLGDATLTVAEGRIAGEVVSTGAVIKNGAGNLRLDREDSLAGAESVEVRQGTVVASADQSFNKLGIDAGGSLDMSGHDLSVREGTAAGRIEDAGAMTKEGGGAFTIANAARAGSVAVEGGVLAVDGDQVTPGSLDVSGGARIVDNAELRVGASGSLVVDGKLTVESGGSIGITYNQDLAGTASVVVGDADFQNGSILNIAGFAKAVDPSNPTPVKIMEIAAGSSAVFDNVPTRIQVGNWDIANVGFITGQVQVSGDQKSLVATLGLAWYDKATNSSGHYSNATGTFNMAHGMEFTVGADLHDRTGTFATGWDGKSLTLQGGAATLILAGDNTYTGGTFVEYGMTLSVSRDANLGSTAATNTLRLNGGTLRVTDSFTTQRRTEVSGGEGTFDIADDKTLRHEGVVEGAGKLVKEGNGTLVLAGTNTHNGTAVRGGTVEVSRDESLGQFGGSLELDNGRLAVTGSFVTGRDIDLGAGGGEIHVAEGKQYSHSGVVSGAGRLKISGDGMVELTGANTYSGGTHVSGHVKVRDDASLGAAAGQLVLDGGTLTAYRTFATSRETIITQSGGVLDIAAWQILTHGGKVTGDGRLNVTGSGQLVLSGLNDYLGGTEVHGATLLVSRDQNLGDASGVLILADGSTLAATASFGTGRTTEIRTNAAIDVAVGAALDHGGNIGGDGALTKQGDGELALRGNNTYAGGTVVRAGAVTVERDENLGDASGALRLDGGVLKVVGDMQTSRATTIASVDSAIDVANDKTLTHSGVIDGTAGLTKTGGGALELLADNTYQGGTTVKGGLVAVGKDSSLGDASGGVLLDGGGVRATDTFATGRQITLGGSGGRLDVEADKALTHTGVLNGAGGLVKTGDGTLVLAGTASHQGGTAINGGAVAVDSDARLGLASAPLSMDGGRLRATESFATSRAVSLGAKGGGYEVDAGKALTQNGVVSGEGGLTKSGDGDLILTGNNTYKGGTAIVAGKAWVSSNANLGDASGKLALDGGGLRATESFSTTRRTEIGASGGEIEVDAAKTLTHGGQIGGEGGLVKTGQGDLALAGANTYKGGTDIRGGAVRVTRDDNLGDASGGLALDGGALVVDGTFATERDTRVGAGGGAFDILAGRKLEHSGVVSGDGALEKRGQGELDLSGTNTYRGGTVINAGTVSVSRDSNLGAASGALAINDATLKATGSFRTSRDTRLGGAGGTFEVAEGSTLAHDGIIDGGPLTKTGGGILALAGANTYSGTTVKGGAVAVSADTNLGAASGELVLDAGALMALDDFATSRDTTLGAGGGGFMVIPDKTLTHNGVITGSGMLVKSGEGALVLTGTNTFLGGTVINAGSVVVSRDENLGDIAGRITITNAGRLRVNESFASQRAIALGAGGGGIEVDDGKTFEHDGVVSGEGMLVKSGQGTLVLKGTNTFLGGTVINAGAVEVSRDENLGASSGGLAMDSGTLRATSSFSTGRATSLGAGGGVFDIVGGVVLTHGGVVSGQGRLIKRGDGVLILSGLNSYAGGTSILGGAVQVSSDRNLGDAAGDLLLDFGTLKVAESFAMDRAVVLGAGGGAFDIADGMALQSAGAISGAGMLVKTGLGHLVLSGAGSQTGGASIREGGVIVRNMSALGTGDTTVEHGASLQLDLDSAGTAGLADFARRTIMKAGSTFNLAYASDTVLDESFVLNNLTEAGAILNLGLNAPGSHRLTLGDGVRIDGGRASLHVLEGVVLAVAAGNRTAGLGGASVYFKGVMNIGAGARLTVDSNLTFESGSRLVLNGSDAGIGQLVLSPGHNLLPGATGRIRVFILDFHESAIGQTVIVAQNADQVVGNIDNILYELMVRNGNEIYINSIHAIEEFSRNRLDDDHWNINIENGGGYFDMVLQSPGASTELKRALGGYFQALADIPREDQRSLSVALRQLYGEYAAYAGEAHAITMDRFHSLVGRRLDQIMMSNGFDAFLAVNRSEEEVLAGLEPGCKVPFANRVWASAFGDWTKQKVRQNIAGYTYDSYGFALGYDYAFDDRFMVGLAGAYDKGNTKVTGLAAKFDSEIAYFGLYGSYLHESNIFVKAGLGAGFGKNDYNVAMLMGGRKNGDFNTRSYSANLELGYIVPVGPDYNLFASAGIDYAYLRRDGWREQATGEHAVAAWFAEESRHRVNVPLMVRLNKVINYDNCCYIIPEISAGYIYAAGRTRPSIGTGFVGSPNGFTIYGADPGHGRWRVSGGVRMRLAQRFEATIDYSLEGRSRYLYQNLSATVGYSF